MLSSILEDRNLRVEVLEKDLSNIKEDLSREIEERCSLEEKLQLSYQEKEALAERIAFNKKELEGLKMKINVEAIACSTNENNESQNMVKFQLIQMSTELIEAKNARFDLENKIFSMKSNLRDESELRVAAEVARSNYEASLRLHKDRLISLEQENVHMKVLLKMNGNMKIQKILDLELELSTTKSELESAKKNIKKFESKLERTHSHSSSNESNALIDLRNSETFFTAQSLKRDDSILDLLDLQSEPTTITKKEGIDLATGREPEDFPPRGLEIKKLYSDEMSSVDSFSNSNQSYLNHRLVEAAMDFKKAETRIIELERKLHEQIENKENKKKTPIYGNKPITNENDSIKSEDERQLKIKEDNCLKSIEVTSFDPLQRIRLHDRRINTPSPLKKIADLKRMRAQKFNVSSTNTKSISLESKELNNADSIFKKSPRPISTSRTRSLRSSSVTKQRILNHLKGGKSREQKALICEDQKFEKRDKTLSITKYDNIIQNKLDKTLSTRDHSSHREDRPYSTTRAGRRAQRIANTKKRAVKFPNRVANNETENDFRKVEISPKTVLTARKRKILKSTKRKDIPITNVE